MWIVTFTDLVQVHPPPLLVNLFKLPVHVPFLHNGIYLQCNLGSIVKAHLIRLRWGIIIKWGCYDVISFDKAHEGHLKSSEGNIKRWICCCQNLWVCDYSYLRRVVTGKSKPYKMLSLRSLPRLDLYLIAVIKFISTKMVPGRHMNINVSLNHHVSLLL